RSGSCMEFVGNGATHHRDGGTGRAEPGTSFIPNSTAWNLTFPRRATDQHLRVGGGEAQTRRDGDAVRGPSVPRFVSSGLFSVILLASPLHRAAVMAGVLPPEPGSVP